MPWVFPGPQSSLATPQDLQSVSYTTPTITNAGKTSIYALQGGGGGAGVSSLDTLTGDITFSSPDGSINIGAVGNDITLEATGGVAGVTSVNTKNGDITINTGPGITVDTSLTEPIITVSVNPLENITKLNGLVGEVELVSSTNTVEIVTFGDEINLNVNPSVVITSLNSQIGAVTLQSSGNTVAITTSLGQPGVINLETAGDAGVTSITADATTLTGALSFSSPKSSISIVTNGQDIELDNNGVTKLNTVVGEITLTSPNGSITVNPNGQNIELQSVAPGPGDTLLGKDITITAEEDNVLNRANCNITAKGGSGGTVSISAETGTLQTSGGLIDIHSYGGFLLPAANGTVNITADAGPDLITGVSSGGLVNIVANTGLNPLALPSAVRLNASAIQSYAGILPAIPTLPGYNVSYGTLGVSLCAGLPAGSLQEPGTVYVFGSSGITLDAPVTVNSLSGVATINGAAYPPPGSAFVDTQQIYVAPNGNDTTGTGSQQNPYLTIAKAITDRASRSALTRVSIILASGTYAENPILKRNTFLIGVPIGVPSLPCIVTGIVTMDDTTGFMGITQLEISGKVIVSTDGADYTISDCNIASGDGSAISVLGGTDVTINNCGLLSTGVVADGPTVIVASSTAIRNCEITQFGISSCLLVTDGLLLQNCNITSQNNADDTDPLIRFLNPVGVGVGSGIFNCNFEYIDDAVDVAGNKCCIQYAGGGSSLSTVFNCLLNCEGAITGTPDIQCIQRTGAGAVTLSYGQLSAGATANKIAPTITAIPYTDVGAPSAFVPFVDSLQIYVAPNGDDTTGTGSQQNPYLTIAKAITERVAYSPTSVVSIILASGNYAENPILKGNTFLVGVQTGVANQPCTVTGIVTMDDTAGTMGLSGLQVKGSVAIQGDDGQYQILNCNISNGVGAGSALICSAVTGALIMSDCYLSASGSDTIQSVTTMTILNCIIYQEEESHCISCSGSNVFISQCDILSRDTLNTSSALVVFSNPASMTSAISFCRLEYTNTGVDAGGNKCCIQYAGAGANTSSVFGSLLLCEGASTGTPVQCIQKTGAGAVNLSYGQLSAVATASAIAPTITATQYTEVGAAGSTPFVDSLQLYVAPNGNDTTGTGSQQNPFQTIGRAITARATLSNTVEVSIILSSGTYTENFTLAQNTFLVGIATGEQSQPCNVVGQITMTATTGQIGLSGLQITSNATTDCVLINGGAGIFSIYNCNITGGTSNAIEIQQGTVYITECRVLSNNLTGAVNPAIAIQSGATVTLRNSTISNQASNPSAVITCNGTLTARFCIIQSLNTASTTLQSLIVFSGSAGKTIEISNCNLTYANILTDTGTNKSCIQFQNATGTYTVSMSNCLLLCEGAVTGAPQIQCIQKPGAGVVNLAYGQLIAGVAHHIAPTITKTQYNTVP